MISLSNKNHPPPESKKILVLVDSRNRNKLKYPSPSNYEIELDDEYEYIEEIELISSHLPTTIYNINKNNNKLYIFVNDIEYIIELPPCIVSSGEYLAKLLNKCISSQIQDIRVEYIKYLDKLVFFNSNCDIFRVIYLSFQGLKLNYPDRDTQDYAYHPNCIAPLLGFNAQNYTSNYGEVNINQLNTLYLENQDEEMYLMESQDIDFNQLIQTPCDTEFWKNMGYLFVSSNQRDFIKVNIVKINHCKSIIIKCDNTITPGIYNIYSNYIISPNIIDLNPHKYVLLQLPNCKRYKNTNKILESAFTEIPLVGFIPYPSTHMVGVNKKFNPILPQMKSIKIKFISYQKDIGFINPQLFDFQGGEHVLIFSIKYRKQSVKY